MQRWKRLALAFGLALAVLALAAPAVLAGPGTTATVLFGNDDVGSPFPPITGHDQSGNAKFNLIPRTATISEGGSVTYDTFVRFGIHQPAVYEPGTTPDEIDVMAFPFVNDPAGRIALGSAVGPAPPGGSATGTWTTPALTAPGRYLVLCNFAPHFAEFDMYGWVNVT